MPRAPRRAGDDAIVTWLTGGTSCRFNPVGKREGGVTKLEPGGDSQRQATHATLWPVGFAVGVPCILVGLVLNWVVVGIGAAIAAVFGFLWVRDLSGKLPAVEAA